MKTKGKGFLILLLVLTLGCHQAGEDVHRYSALGIVYSMPEWCDVAAGGNLRAYRIIEMGRLPNLDPVLIGNYSREAPDAVAEVLGWRYSRVVPMEGFTEQELYYGTWPALAHLIPSLGNPGNITNDTIEGAIKKYRYLADPRLGAVADLLVEERPSIVLGEHHASYMALARAARNLSGKPVGSIVFDAHADTYLSENETISHGGFYEIKNSWVVGTALLEDDVGYTLILGTVLEPKYLPGTHQIFPRRELPYVGSDIYITTQKDLSSQETTREDIGAFFDELEKRGIDSIIISIDMDVLNKETYHGFKYNEAFGVVCIVAQSYVSNTGIPIEAAYASVDKRGANLSEVMNALDFIYEEADRRGINILFQEITELDGSLDRNGETTRAAVELARKMAPRTAGGG